MVTKYFDAVDAKGAQFSIQEMIELMIDYEFIPRYVSLKDIIDVFIGLLMFQFDCIQPFSIEKYLNLDQFRLEYNSVLMFFVHYAIRLNIAEHDLEKDRVCWFFCTVFSRG